ncbi:hypothetical protein Tco_1316568 [Tanacetum coccineum]
MSLILHQLLEIQGDAQEDKLTTKMMLLVREITQRYSTPTNNHLRTSSNTRNQAVIQDGRVDIQSKNVGYAGNGGNLNEEENNFMLDNHYEDDSLEELNASVIMMAHIQPADNNDDTKIKHDSKTISEYQIDYSIIFDDPYVDNDDGTYEHDSNAHEQSVALESLIYNVKKEAKNKRSLNNLKKQKALLQKELETCKEWVRTLENNQIRHETELSKKAFKECQKSYLDELVDLAEKLSSHDRIVYRMGQSIQTIHMLGKKPNKVYDPFLKAGLGYKNPERLKKAIKAQSKIYDGD